MQASDNGRKLLQGGGYYQHNPQGEYITPASKSTKNNHGSGSKGIQAALPGINSIKHTKNVGVPLYTNNTTHNGGNSLHTQVPPFVEFDPS